MSSPPYFDGNFPTNDLKLEVVRLSEHAILPKKGTEKSAGYDLSSCKSITIPARSRGLVPTDLAFIIPDDCYGRIAPRSSLALSYGIDVGAGVIDADYRGAVGIVLFNHSDNEFNINKGDRVAQLIIERICHPKVTEVKSFKDSQTTKRNTNGFGSTDKKK
jgi:dUTP pyrophosphatase